MAAGAEIKRLRGNISAQQAASLIGVDVERLRKWEQRDVDPKDSGDIQKVEAFFKTSVSKLKTLETFQFFPRETKTNEASKEPPDYNERSLTNLTESNKVLAEANRTLAEANKTLAEANHVISKNHDELIQLTKMIVAVNSGGGQLAKPSLVDQHTDGGDDRPAEDFLPANTNLAEKNLKKNKESAKGK